MRRCIMIDGVPEKGRGRPPGRLLTPRVAALASLLSLGLACSPAVKQAAPTGVKGDHGASTAGGANMGEGTGNTAKVPADFCIDLSSGGGFTGAYQGTRVSGDGKVVRWKTGPNAGGQQEEDLGRIDQAALSRLWSAAQASRFFELSLDEPGNMTVVLSVTGAGQEHVVRYPQSGDQHPEAVRPLVEQLKREVRPLEEAQSGGK